MWLRRNHLHDGASRRMRESHAPSMQRVATVPHRLPVAGKHASTIEVVPNERVSDGGKMQTHLMGAPGVQARCDNGGPGTVRHYSVRRHCARRDARDRFAVRPEAWARVCLLGPDNSLPHRMVRVWPRQAVNRALRWWVAMYDGEVVTVETTGPVSTTQTPRRRSVSCARRVPIKPMDRSNRLNAPAGVAVPPRHGVRDGARLFASRRMSQYACGLCHRKHLVVFKEDLKRYLCVGNDTRLPFGIPSNDGVSGPAVAMRCVRRFAIDRHRTEAPRARPLRL